MRLLYANDTPGRYPASWYAATTPLPESRPRLEGGIRADVCVIGGGYTGLSAALHLAKRGVDVVLIEAHRAGFGASGRNGGQVGSGQRLAQTTLERMLGETDARALWQMGEDAKALVRRLIDDHRIACDWRDGILQADWSAGELHDSLAEAEHLSRAYGYDRLEPLDREGLAQRLGSPVYAGGVLDHGAGHLNPLAYALGLARAADSAGARVFEETPATALHPGPRPVVITPRGRIEADQVILACNGYLEALSPPLAARVMPINNFIVATEPLGPRARAIIDGDFAVADSKFVVNYFRLSPDGRLLFGGGESYGYRFPADIAAKVRKPMLEVFPQLADVRIDHAWGGTLAITMNRLPCFMRPAPGVLAAGGYSGHGVALASLAGAILAEAVAGESARFDLMARLPMSRFPGGTALRSPLLVLAMTWFALRDRLGI